MTVFKFNVFYDSIDDYQVRFVVATDEAEAFEKINAHFDKMKSEGFMHPSFISEAFVELDNVIL